MEDRQGPISRASFERVRNYHRLVLRTTTVAEPNGRGIAADRGKVAEIYSDDPTFGYRLSQPHGDRSLATAAIKDGHIGSNMSEEKLGIDIRAAWIAESTSSRVNACFTRGPDVQEELPSLS